MTEAGKDGANGRLVRFVHMTIYLILAAIFLLAGATKLLDTNGLERLLVVAFSSKTLATIVAWTLPPLEILLALGLVASRGGQRTALICLAFMIGTTLVLGRLYFMGENIPCDCFGSTIGRLMGFSLESAFIRNGVMIAGTMFLIATGTKRL